MSKRNLTREERRSRIIRNLDCACIVVLALVLVVVLLRWAVGV